MEPEVKIVDRYFQECKNFFTMTNRRVKGNKEIDLLAFNPKTNEVSHVEVSVLFRALKLRETIYRDNSNRSRDGLNYFLERKFDHPDIKEGISKILGQDLKIKRILVVSEIDEQEEEIIRETARGSDLEIMLIGKCIEGLKEVKSGSRVDVVRTIELMSKYCINKK